MTEAKPKVTAESPKNIYQLISIISEEAGALEKINAGGVPFPFRGVDSTINHLSPYLRKYGVVVIPSVSEHEVTARDLPNNKALTQSKVSTDFTFVAPDGTSFTATTVGLAQDHADRSAAQAQSVAFRVALLQVFALPTQSPEPEVAGEENAKAIEKATAEAPKATKAPSETVDTVRASIGAIIADAAKPQWTSDTVNTLAKELTNTEPATWFNSLPSLKKIRAEIEKRDAA